jgi:hypothetical protein
MRNDISTPKYLTLMNCNYKFGLSTVTNFTHFLAINILVIVGSKSNRLNFKFGILELKRYSKSICLLYILINLNPTITDALATLSA